MTQFCASFVKTLKTFLRIRGVLVWTLAWPVLLLVVVTTTALGAYSGSILAMAKGSTTISMAVFSVVLAGFANLASSAARDRETGLLAKLKSMPVNPVSDLLGRVGALAILSILGTALVTAAGLALGAQFDASAGSILGAVGFLFLMILGAAGVGLVIGSLVRALQTAVFLGIGLAVVSLYATGIFVPYTSLPAALQAFARVYPISSSASSIAYLLLGQDGAGYNPLTTTQLATTVALSCALLAIGAFLHSRLLSQRD